MYTLATDRSTLQGTYKLYRLFRLLVPQYDRLHRETSAEQPDSAELSSSYQGRD